MVVGQKHDSVRRPVIGIATNGLMLLTTLTINAMMIHGYFALTTNIQPFIHLGYRSIISRSMLTKLTTCQTLCGRRSPQGAPRTSRVRHSAA
jgi:hypothetical protein